MIERYQTPEMKILWSDAHRYAIWAEVERLALEAWETLGEVPVHTAQRLREALREKPIDAHFAERVAALEAETRHDMVAFTRTLTDWVDMAEVDRYLHLGLTSTDVVDTAQNVLLVRAHQLLDAALSPVLQALRRLALAYKNTPAVGRTHGVHAEPTSFGLRFLSFYAALTRDQARLTKAGEGIRVGVVSGSVGNYAHVPPEVEAHVCRGLGLIPEPISTQVVPRDRHAELLFALASLGTDIERIAVELRHLQRTEVLETQEGFGQGQTGSSSMPHKKNPIGLENLSGLARLLRANLQAALENVALWHERDISHSSVERIILPDSTTLAHYMLERLHGLLDGLVVREDNIARNLDITHGLVYSQRVLGLLIKEGLPRNRAYDLVQRSALASWSSNQPFLDGLLSDPENPLGRERLQEAFDPAWYLRHVDTIYARFGLGQGSAGKAQVEIK